MHTNFENTTKRPFLTKAQIKGLIIETIVLIILGASILFVSLCIKVDELKDEHYQMVETSEESDSKYGIRTKIGDDVESEYVTDADEHYSALPQNVQDFITDKGIVIMLQNDYIGGIEEGATTASIGQAETRFDKCFILVKKDCIDSALVHEIGHSVDTLYNGNTLHKLSDTTEFKSLYEEEKDGFYPVTSSEEVRNYLRSTRLEYFAESFLMYIQYPDYLQDMCPKTYEYMENLVENI